MDHPVREIARGLLDALGYSLGHALVISLSRCILRQQSASVDRINVLHDPPHAITWTHEQSGQLWLSDFLPLDLPIARIMTFRHDFRWKRNALDKDLYSHGKQFLDALEAKRVSPAGRG